MGAASAGSLQKIDLHTHCWHSLTRVEIQTMEVGYCSPPWSLASVCFIALSGEGCVDCPGQNDSVMFGEGEKDLRFHILTRKATGLLLIKLTSHTIQLLDNDNSHLLASI